MKRPCCPPLTWTLTAKRDHKRPRTKSAGSKRNNKQYNQFLRGCRFSLFVSNHIPVFSIFKPTIFFSNKHVCCRSISIKRDRRCGLSVMHSCFFYILSLFSLLCFSISAHVHSCCFHDICGGLMSCSVSPMSFLVWRFVYVCVGVHVCAAWDAPLQSKMRELWLVHLQ